MGACERRKEGMEAASIPQLPWLSGQVVEDALLCVALVHSEPGCFPLCVCFLFPPSPLHWLTAAWEVLATTTP